MLGMSAAPQPRWLSAEQQAVWRVYLDGVARIQDALDADLRSHGLDLAEYEILVRLSESDDRSMRMSDLAEATRQSRSRLTHTVTRLERNGHVTRAPAPDDRRGVMASLTDAGYALLERAAPHHVAAVRAVLVDVADPADFAALGRVMGAVMATPAAGAGS